MQFYQNQQNMKPTLYHVFIYFGTFMVYASLHALREGWSYSKSQVSEEFGVSKEYLGIVDALYLVSYSSGMFILGSLLHKISLKTYVVIGLTTASVSYMLWTVLYAATGFYNVVLMTILMMINGFFQATGWPGIMGIFSNWFVGHKKGLLMGIWSCSANIGDIIASALLNVLDDNGVNLVWNFVLTGGMGLLVAFILFLFLKEKPQVKDYQNFQNSLIEEETKEIQEEEASDSAVIAIEAEGQEDSPNTFKYGIISALFIPRVPYYVFSYACLKGCIYGLLFWLPSILDEHTGPISDQKGYISAMFDVGAVVGALSVGFMSDYFNKKAIFLSPCLFLCAIIMFLISFALGDEVWPYYITIFLAGTFISGPYNIIGTVITIDIGSRIKEKGGVAKVSSLIEAVAAVFAMVEMVVIPHLSEAVVFYLFTAQMLVATVLLIPVFLQEFREIKGKSSEGLTGIESE